MLKKDIKLNTKTMSETGSKTGSETDSETEFENSSKTVSETDSETDFENGSKTENKTENKNETENETSSETSTKTDSKNYIYLMMEKLKNFNKSITNDENTIILTCVIKNEYLLLEYFIKHYINIGVTHFVFIDNGSTDDTIKYLLEHSANIMLFKTEDSFKIHKANWINSILNSYCNNKWSIVVDVDELIYINHLNELKNELIKKKANVCNFYLLDMYPKNYDTEYIRGDSFFNHSNYYDKESDINKNFYSGVRKRTINSNSCLKKISFFKYEFSCCNKTKIGHHDLHNFADHDCVKVYKYTQILLHFKFIRPELKKFFNECINNQYCNNIIEYKDYLNAEHYNFYDPNYSLCINDIKPEFKFITKTIISIGSICQSAAQIYANTTYREETNFFDWLITDFKSVLYILKNISKKKLISEKNFTYKHVFLNRDTWTIHKKIEHKEFKMISVHDIDLNTPNKIGKNQFTSKYFRRLNRLKNIINENHTIHMIHLIDDRFCDKYIPTNIDIKLFFNYIDKINKNNNCILHIIIPPKYNDLKLDIVLNSKIYIHKLVHTYDVPINWECNNLNWDEIINKINEI